MRTVVVAHEEIQPALTAWLHSLGETRAERDQRFTELWTEFVQSIVAAGDPPVGSIEDATKTPTSYWCGFPGDGLARVVVEGGRRPISFRRERRVVVVELVFSPLPPG